MSLEQLRADVKAAQEARHPYKSVDERHRMELSDLRESYQLRKAETKQRQAIGRESLNAQHAIEREFDRCWYQEAKDTLFTEHKRERAERPVEAA